ncbi:nardilysin-like isoform 1-T3 [Cochliomyia hominivorax]
MSTAKDLALNLQYLETPDKSENDKKDYKCFILSNGLKVLLVSDCKTGCESKNECLDLKENEPQKAEEKLSAVAILLDVGAYHQPRNYEGLAHFLEHMLFMGSEKYPVENSFDKHLTKYGGMNNACTEGETTMYYFEVPEQHLESSLEHLVAQIMEPLLLEESMTREREAVESEYQLSLNNDEIRRFQLMQSLGSEHFPHNSFIWGNLKSLKEDIESEQALNKTLREFYKRHYSAHRMFACIQSQLPLQQMEQMAVALLQDIKNNEMPGLNYKDYNYREAFKREFFEEVFFIKPIANINNLDLTWVLPPTLQLYKYKSEDFLSHLIGYEGEGSLCAYLRKRLWALEVMSEADITPMFTLFNINITLTELGLENMDAILYATFAYVKLFNSAAKLKEIYEELSFIKASNFRFASEISPIDNVQYLVKSCRKYPSKDILTGPLLYYQFSETELQNLINHLNEFHFNIAITSNKPFEGAIYDKKEKWFGAEYSTKKIPQKWCDLWQNNSNIEELFLPQPNPFVAKDFHIFCKEKNVSDMPQAPEKLLQTDLYELWFRQDDRFQLPHGYMYFFFMSPLMRKNSKNPVIGCLYLDLVQYYLVEELYPATVAGINYQIFCTEKGVVMSVDGYNEKLHLVIDILIKAFISTKDRIKENELETFKKQYQKNSFNELLKPVTVNRDLEQFMLKDLYCSKTEMFKFIPDVTLSEVQNFAKEFCEELYVQALIQGNLEKETAFKVMDSVMNNLKCEKIKEKYFIEDRGIELPLGAHKILCHNLNPKDCNTVVVNFYQIGARHLRQECIINLLLMILEAPLYDNLRTKEQLGYSVSCSLSNHHGVMGYYIHVSSQETKHNVALVEERIEAFRLNIQKLLQDLSLEDFNNFKKSLIKLREIKDITLYEEVSRSWNEITTEEYLFDRKLKEIEILQTLEMEDILEFWQEHKECNERKLSVQVMGNNKATENTEQNNTDDKLDNNLCLTLIDCDKNVKSIMNLQEFKDKLKVYPVIKTEI